MGLLILALFVVGACAGESIDQPIDDGEWVGTITTSGGVTTVINESGSVWSRRGTLVEEASIGVEIGPDEYMLGGVGSVYATDRHIYVVDGQVPAVRIYDYAGQFVGNLGGPGQGPGEYERPDTVTGAADGRLFVLHDHQNRINVYAADGAPIATWTAQSVPFWPIHFAADGTLWLPVTDYYGPGRDDWRRAIQAHGQDGAYGPMYPIVEPEFEPLTTTVGGRERENVPFAPRLVWTTAGPATLLVGVGDRYRFEFQTKGGIVRIVERYWTPTPIAAEHIEFARQLTLVQMRGAVDATWDWDGADIPRHAPAFDRLHSAESGETWVLRRGESRQVRDCIDPAANYREAVNNPCWRSPWFFDVFDPEGRYLGSVDKPEELSRSPRGFYARGDTVVGIASDASGTAMVKRYRLVPGR